MSNDKNVPNDQKNIEQEPVFEVNADRNGADKKGDAPAADAEKAAKCKDCDEYQCWQCDNEGCENNEKEQKCKSIKDYVEPYPCAKCEHARDTAFECKDCDEYQCWQCDNEATGKKPEKK